MTTAQDQQSRAEFESAVVARMKESGFLEVEIRTECLVLDGDSYMDPQIAFGWAIWQAARALPADVKPAAWTLTETLDKRETTTTARLWFSDPVNYMWTGLFTAAQVQAMLTHEKASRQAAQQQLEASKADLAKLEMYRFMLAHRGRGDDANTAQTRMDAGSGRGYGLPPGWQAVPVEPTHQMQSAALKYVVRQHQTRDVWRTMLAAAPQTPAAQVLAMGHVPECPYPCGWDGLHKIAVADAAYLARTEWPEDEEGVSVKRATVMRNIGYLIDVCRALIAAAPRPPAAQEESNAR